MRKILALMLCVMVAGSSIEACVTYNKSTGTYTVSPDGCVDQNMKNKPVKKTKKSKKKDKK